MTYLTASGVPIPQGTDAFSPPAQFKDWGDKSATYENHVIVATVADRNALATPVLRPGLLVHVLADSSTYLYLNSSAGWWLWSKPPVTYTPTITGMNSGGTRLFKWWVAGGEVVVSGQISGILFSAITGVLGVSVPYTGPDSAVGTALGRGMVVDASLGNIYDTPIRVSGPGVTMDRVDTSGASSALKPLTGLGITGTNGIVMVFNFRYLPA